MLEIALYEIVSILYDFIGNNMGLLATTANLRLARPNLSLLLISWI